MSKIHTAHFSEYWASGYGKEELAHSVLALFAQSASIPMPSAVCVANEPLHQDEIDVLHEAWQTEHRRRRDAAVECYGSCDFPGGQ